MKRIFDRTNRRPKRIRHDSGGEFKNRWVKSMLGQYGIKSYSTKNETKANFAERVIRTIKVLMYRYFSQKQTYKYTDILQSLINNYNKSPHTTLNGRTPHDINQDNEPIVWKEMYVDTAFTNVPSKPRKFKLKVGDTVRLSHLKYNFQRDYQHKWTEDIFKIKNRFKKSGISLYELTDYANDPIEGTFYENELQKVSKDDNSSWKIEKNLKRRKRNNQSEMFVKFRGWPAKFNAWVKETDTQLL